MTTMTADFAREFLGEELFNELNDKAPEFSMRCCEDPTEVEFSASIKFKDDCEHDCVATAYYYQDKDKLEATDDMSDLNWSVDHYELG
jgi:hypothetical protein